MNLHYRIEGQGNPIVLIHGLFGSLDNLGLMARSLKESHQVISVDLRNHGRSPHSETLSYSLMASDIIRLLSELNIDNYSVVGHSMGGKVAMSLAQQAKQEIDKLIVLDIAPVDYALRRHDAVFAGLKSVAAQEVHSRTQAEQLLSQHIEEPGVRQFLLKSLAKGDKGFQWRFNLDGLIANYDTIMGWEEIAPFHGQTLFIKGQNSEYIDATHRPAIQSQFPNAKAHMVANTGHWLHAEKPDTVNRIILSFLHRT